MVSYIPKENVNVYTIHIPQGLSLKNTNKSLSALIYDDLLNSNIELRKRWRKDEVDCFLKLGDESNIYRGVKYKDENEFSEKIEQIKKYGTDRINRDVPAYPGPRSKGLAENKYIFGSPYLDQAMEFTKNNPQIISIYDSTKLEKIIGTDYAYAPINGFEFSDALKCILVVYDNEAEYRTNTRP